MNTRSTGVEPIPPLFDPESLIRTRSRRRRRTPFVPLANRVPRVPNPTFDNLFEAKVVYNPFTDQPFPMADDQPMWAANRAVAPTLGSAIVPVNLGNNFTVKGHHLSMIKDR